MMSQRGCRQRLNAARSVLDISSTGAFYHGKNRMLRPDGVLASDSYKFDYSEFPWREIMSVNY
jgi:hypothetical protein